MKELLQKIIESPMLHARWLNTLSFLENCGARLIAAFEHPTLVKEEVLKHAAEEFRHSHHLKRQIEKLSMKMETYSDILGGYATLHYLPALNLKTSRHLKEEGFTPLLLKEAAYLLVTYAIELRASELYPLYHEALQKAGSKVAIKSILLEEEAHLNDMREGLKKIPLGTKHAEIVCTIESDLYMNWLNGLSHSILLSQ